MNVMNKLSKSSTAWVMFVCCILCSLISSVSPMCPDNVKEHCGTAAGILNCILCIVVLAHFMGMFKK